MIPHTASSPCRKQSGIWKLAEIARFSKEMSWRTASVARCVGKYLVDFIQLSSYKDAKQKGIAKPPEHKTDFAIGVDPEVMYDALENMAGI